MANKAYLKGRRLEYKVKNLLKVKGCFVIRQASSHFPDIMAVLPNELEIEPSVVLAIECKSGTAKISKREREELEALSKKYGFLSIIATKKDREKIIYKVFYPGDCSKWGEFDLDANL